MQLVSCYSHCDYQLRKSCLGPDDLDSLCTVFQCTYKEFALRVSSQNAIKIAVSFAVIVFY